MWLDEFVDKIIRKHHVNPEEVEEIFSGGPLTRRIKTGKVKGEDLFVAFGTTDSGRYLHCFVCSKNGRTGLGHQCSGNDQK